MASDPPVVLAWERQENEPEEAWLAFRAYRDQIPPRRMVHAAVKSTAQLSAWFNEWKWSDRAAAYDRHVDGIRREEREAILRQDEKDRAARQLSQLKGVQDLVDRELAKLIRDSADTEAFGLIKVSDLNKLLANSITLERLIRGESTSNEHMDVDLSALSVDDLRKLRELQSKMTKKPDDEDGSSGA